MRILVIEDDPSLLKTFIRQLHILGHETIEAMDLTTAQHHVSTKKDLIDCILTDTELVGVNGNASHNGWEILPRSNEAKIPVIAMSGNERYGDIWNKKGVDIFLLKPFRRVVLQEALQKIESK